MNLNAKRGDAVRYTSRYGLNCDNSWARKCGLRPRGVYTVESLSIRDFSSRVVLREFPGHWFNTVLFDDIVIPTKGGDDVEENEQAVTLVEQVKSLQKELETVKAAHLAAEKALECERDFRRQQVTELGQAIVKRNKVIDGWRRDWSASESRAQAAESRVEEWENWESGLAALSGEISSLRDQLRAAEKQSQADVQWALGIRDARNRIVAEWTRTIHDLRDQLRAEKAAVDAANLEIYQLRSLLRAEKAVDLPADAKEMLVRVAYQAGEISLDRAAELAGQNRQDLQKLGWKQGPGLSHFQDCERNLEEARKLYMGFHRDNQKLRDEIRILRGR